MESLREAIGNLQKRSFTQIEDILKKWLEGNGYGLKDLLQFNVMLYRISCQSVENYFLYNEKGIISGLEIKTLDSGIKIKDSSAKWEINVKSRVMNKKEFGAFRRFMDIEVYSFKARQSVSRMKTDFIFPVEGENCRCTDQNFKAMKYKREVLGKWTEEEKQN